MPGPHQQKDALRSKLTVEQLDLVLRRLDSLPTLPAVAMRLLALTTRAARDSSCRDEATEQITRLVGSDQALTAKLLSLVNRCRPGSACTVEQAVGELGFEAVRSVALSIEVFETLDRQERSDSGLDWPAFWRHCLAVASAAEMLAAGPAGAAGRKEAFACGLLHDLGKLALAQCLPKSYRRVLQAVRVHNGNIADHERSIIGVDHSVAGRRLAEHWCLPEPVKGTIWLHHQPIEAIPTSLPYRELIGIVSLADAIARGQRFGFSGNHSFARSYEELAGQLGIPPAAVESVIERLPAAIEERAGLLGLEEVRCEKLYREALANANAELGRLNDQLRREAGPSPTQARALRCLRDFSEAARPDATVSDILTRIGGVMAAARNIEPTAARPVLAYSLDAEGAAVLAVRCDGSDSPEVRRFSRRPGQAAAGWPNCLADENEPAEWVDVSAYAHQELRCGGRAVGGVLYPEGPAGRDPQAEETCEALAGALGLALAVVRERCRAVLLSEQLAGASQALAETQQAMAEAKTLAAVGEMAAGAGHELNTPLAVVSGRAQLMRERARTAEERRTWQLIADQAQQISDIISELMEFASPPEPRPAPVDVGELLTEARRALCHPDDPQAGAARVDIQVDESALPVWVDKEQIRAAILELMRNAAAAGQSPQIRLAAEGDEINNVTLISIRDDGPGMDPRTLAKAYTPFFSSQQAGRRRGLGLPRARRFIENNGGRIWITSRPPEGTTVFIQLPAARGRPTEPGES